MTELLHKITNAKDEITRKIRKGIQQPEKIPPYLLVKFFPEFANSHGIYETLVDFRDDFITFRFGGFVQGAKSYPGFCARLYYDVTTLQRMFEDVGPDHADSVLEIGCGYGRLTPWVADFATEAHAIDPNERVVQVAQEQHPHIDFRAAFAQSLPYADDSFDLIVSWTVLQSIPPDTIQDVTAEMMRVLAPDGTLIVAEQVQKPDREITWSRSESRYEALFAPLELLESRPRPLEPTFDPDNGPGAVYDEFTGNAYHPVERIMAFSGGTTDYD